MVDAVLIIALAFVAVAVVVIGYGVAGFFILPQTRGAAEGAPSFDGLARRRRRGGAQGPTEVED